MTQPLILSVPIDWTVADLLAHLGGIPASRVRLQPPPGTATERDVVAIHDRENRLCELVDGILVEKPMGFYESRLAVILIQLLETFTRERDLGIVAGEAGMVRLAPGRVRIPDVGFVSWSRLPGRQIPRTPIPDLVPDLAVEILSQSNTKAEMERKLDEYFAAGVRLVWYLDPENRTLTVHAPGSEPVQLGEGEALTGGEVLPGFAVAVAEIFARAERRA